MARSIGTKPDPPELMKTGSVNIVNGAGSSRSHVLFCSNFMLRTFLLDEDDEGFAIPQSSPAILEHLSCGVTCLPLETVSLGKSKPLSLVSSVHGTCSCS